MLFFKKKKTKKEETAAVRKKRREVNPADSEKRSFFDTSKSISIVIFLAIWALIVMICFVGLSPAGPQVLPNRIAKFRVVADFPYTYESALRTKRLADQRRQAVAPFYTIDLSAFQGFSERIASLRQQIETTLRPELEALAYDQWLESVDRFNRRQVQDIGLLINTEDLLLIMQRTSPEQRERLFDESLLVLRDILRDGVYDPVETPFAEQPESGYRPVHVLGMRGSREAQSEEEAVPLLRINLAGLGVEGGLSRALYRIFRRGLTPNLRYDPVRTEEEKLRAVESVQPVIVQVSAGETLIEPGAIITPDQIEAYNAYRDKMAERADYGWGIDSTLAERALLTLGLLMCALIYVQIGMPASHRSNRRLILAALVILFNLALIRLVLQLGETRILGGDAGLMAMLPFAAPVAVGGIIMAIMVGPAAGVLVAVVVCTLNGLMQANSIDVFIISLLANLVGIYFGKDIRLRAKVVRAGLMSGITIAIAATFAGLLTEADALTVGRQILAAGLVGVITGVIVIGVLPLLEHLFKYTTDITLLELTDFNHPLLRKLQLVAPGTYHHSLMVANLAERAASEIGANPLICRATCLYHDIGKMVKPEYFAENQQDGYNPHKEKNPSMSALIIKNHVKEGVHMAREAKLPKICVDIIQQHHGTTLIKFFYHKALEQASQPQLPLSASGQTAGLRDSGSIDEATFRYDGPRPRFKESAIIFLADAVEAASRSLRKVTPQSVQELIDSIITDRLEDGQLDEAPLTMQEIGKIRDSFAFTTLNMLHSRVEYPKNPKEVSGKATNTPIPLPNHTRPPHVSKESAAQ